MTSVPPPSPSLWRPELPDGVEPSEPPVPPVTASGRLERANLPGFVWWAPFLAALITLVVSLIGFVLITIGVETAGTTIDPDDLPPGVTLGGTLIQDLALVGATILAARITANPTPWAFGLRRIPLRTGIKWAAIGFGCFYVLSIIWAVALGIDESDDLAQKLGADESTLNLVAVTGLVTIAAPICEEFFFRGFLFPAVWRAIGLWPAVVVDGIMFGAVHAGGTDAKFLVPLAAFGAVLCLVYRYSGSLLPCMGLHAVNNALALGVTLGWEWWQVLIGIVAAPCVVIGLVYPLTGSARRLESLPGS